MNANLYPSFSILIIDDEELVLETIGDMLRSSGITRIVQTTDVRGVLDLVREKHIGVILLDLTMPVISGKELLPLVKAEYPEIPVIIVTGDTDISTAVDCIKTGAFDYLVKPVKKSDLTASVKRAIEIQELKQENLSLKKHLFTQELDHPEAFSSIITRNETMRSMLMYVESVSLSGKTVLITGETGTGKELIAQAIHKVSGVKCAFVAVNVAGFEDSMFADTLFGHTRGSYTGAEQARAGLIEKARGGTLFLDEIGDLSQLSQVKLLRLLETFDYLPVGSDVPKRSDARIIVATNKDLFSLVESGSFRKDLYFRFITHHIEIPPLRERKDDLKLLVDYFLNEAAADLGKKVPAYPPELITLLETYAFPGNVRELKAYIYDAVSSHKSGILSTESFRRAFGIKGMPQAKEKDQSVQFPDTLPTIKELTEILVDEALVRAKGNQTIAAQLLGISQPALNKRIKQRKT